MTDITDLEREYDRAVTELHDQFIKDVGARIAEILGVETFSFDGENFPSYHFKKLTIDGYSILDVRIDEYNNFYCRFDVKIPIDVMAKFHSLLINVIEHKNTYRHRTGTGLYICYYEKFHDALTVDEIVSLCEDNLRSPESATSNFKEWLVGTSYSSTPNIERYSERGWVKMAAFRDAVYKRLGVPKRTGVD